MQSHDSSTSYAPPAARARGAAAGRASLHQALGRWREYAVYGLLFLLPVGGVSVRHWISSIFTLLALLALPDLVRARARVTIAERALLVIVAAFFGVFLLTSFANGWSHVQTSHLGTEIRFLFFIPIYFMVRRYPAAGVWLLRGGLVGGLVLFGQALYDLYVLRLAQAQGIYSPNLLGPYAALLSVFALTLRRIDRSRPWMRYAVSASVLFALAAMLLSGSRGAYVGFIGMVAVWGALRLRGWRQVLPVLVALGVIAVGYQASDAVRYRIDKAGMDFISELDGNGPERNGPRLDSVPARLEMWRAAAMIFRDNAVFGVGRGNYAGAARKYVEQGQVHPDVTQHSHPHNAYLEMMVSKGSLGLLAFLALLLYPLAVFARTHRRARETALLGMTLITGFALFSLTDASPFIKGNFISLFLIYLAAVFAWHTERLRGQQA